MGHEIFSSYDYISSMSSRGVSYSSDEERRSKERKHDVTSAARQKVRKTGKLDPAVDPAIDTIRRSLIRFEATEDKKWRVSVGCPMDIESTLDSTGSMGDNVDKAIAVLPDTYALASEMLPGYDVQIACGIFGDVVDDFVLNRPQFEMTAEKIVDYLTRMNPEGEGGDSAEDPQYAMFASAYFTAAYTNRIGLKGYFFLITDASMHSRISKDMLKRIFGDNFLEKLHENGYEGDEIPDMQDVAAKLKETKHAFVIAVEGNSQDRRYWGKWFGAEHVICVPDTAYLPEIEAAIIGLTEGTLEPIDLEKWLKNHQVDRGYIDYCQYDLRKVPYGAQRKLEEASEYKIPKLGDIFEKKTDLQPCGHEDKPLDSPDPKEEDGSWL